MKLCTGRALPETWVRPVQLSYIKTCWTQAYAFLADLGRTCFPFFLFRAGLFITFPVNPDQSGPNFFFLGGAAADGVLKLPGRFHSSQAQTHLGLAFYYCLKNNTDTIHIFNGVFKSLIWFNKLQINILWMYFFFFDVF